MSKTLVQSGPVVYVAIGDQKMIWSARRDMGDLKKAGSLIAWGGAYLDLKKFYWNTVKNHIFTCPDRIQKIKNGSKCWINLVFSKYILEIAL